MKAWLKGGLIGALVFIIIASIYLFSCPRCVGICQPRPLCKTFSFLGWGSEQATIIFILTFLTFIIIGSLIGLIIGKIKSKK